MPSEPTIPTPAELVDLTETFINMLQGGTHVSLSRAVVLAICVSWREQAAALQAAIAKLDLEAMAKVLKCKAKDLLK